MTEVRSGEVVECLGSGRHSILNIIIVQTQGLHGSLLRHCCRSLGVKQSANIVKSRQSNLKGFKCHLSPISSGLLCLSLDHTVPGELLLRLLLQHLDDLLHLLLVLLLRAAPPPPRPRPRSWAQSALAAVIRGLSQQVGGNCGHPPVLRPAAAARFCQQ